MLFKEQKERTLLLHSAEARYLNFMEQFSDLVNRIPDYQLASYLGISPVSLCRIKKRLEQKRGSTGSPPFFNRSLK
ncbi:hypothetical protein NFHSH190041_04510 [Shewanella sp. NFH-SH190041]|nr:hypothetical protein NFHSH190041_04510 [Shewanella sp. NFH-SH190041]